jgi:hypothetical protein
MWGDPPVTTDGRARDAWTFLTNHAHVLLALARDPETRLRDVAASVGITERAVQGIVADLERAGYVARVRVGRRNHYRLHPEGHFRHPAEAGHRIGELLDLFVTPPETDRSAEDGPAGAGTRDVGAGGRRTERDGGDGVQPVGRGAGEE